MPFSTKKNYDVSFEKRRVGMYNALGVHESGANDCLRQFLEDAPLTETLPKAAPQGAPLLIVHVSFSCIIGT